MGLEIERDIGNIYIYVLYITGNCVLKSLLAHAVFGKEAL